MSKQNKSLRILLVVLLIVVGVFGIYKLSSSHTTSPIHTPISSQKDSLATKNELHILKQDDNEVTVKESITLNGVNERATYTLRAVQGDTDSILSLNKTGTTTFESDPFKLNKSDQKLQLIFNVDIDGVSQDFPLMEIDDFPYYLKPRLDIIASEDGSQYSFKQTLNAFGNIIIENEMDFTSLKIYTKYRHDVTGPTELILTNHESRKFSVDDFINTDIGGYLLIDAMTDAGEHYYCKTGVSTSGSKNISNYLETLTKDEFDTLVSDKTAF